MALDRQRIVTVAISGYSHPADVTGLSEGYRSLEGRRPEQARRLDHL